MPNKITRLCEDCGSKLAPYQPRRNQDGRLICPACAVKPGGGSVYAKKDVRTELQRMYDESDTPEKVPHPVGMEDQHLADHLYAHHGYPNVSDADRETLDFLHAREHQMLPFHDQDRLEPGEFAHEHDKAEDHSKTAAVKLGHGAGNDPSLVMACPFCGSGQILGRSDNTIECQICHQCFTVRNQPMYSSSPQFINGQPVEVPGLPPETPVGQSDDPDAMGGLDMPPGDDEGSDGPPWADDSDDGDGSGDDEEEDDSGPPGSIDVESPDKDDKDDDKKKSGNQPPWLKKSQLLDYATYAESL